MVQSFLRAAKSAAEIRLSEAGYFCNLGPRRQSPAKVQCTFMRNGLRKWWPWLKALLALAIVLAVGRQFLRDLQSHPELWNLSFSATLIFLSGLVYVLGLGFSA